MVAGSTRGIGEIIEVERGVFASAPKAHQAETVEGRADLALLGLELDGEHLLVELDGDLSDTVVGLRVVAEIEIARLAGRQEDGALHLRTQLAFRGDTPRAEEPADARRAI